MRLGVDLGGTKIEIMALDDAGDVVFNKRVPTPRGSYADIVGTVTQLVAQADRDLGQTGSIGVGIPGTHLAATGLIKNANTTELIGKPLWRDLEAGIGRPVCLANDANCFALSEARGGAGRGHAVVFGVILGTGCGGGVVVDGRVLGGAHGLAGEWGHNRLPDLKDWDYPLPPCYCGRRGCVETYVSGPGFTADFASLSPRGLSAPEIAAAATAGDQAALLACERFEDRLARSLAVIVNILDPDCIVFGGGLSHLPRIYTEVPKMLGSYTFGPETATPLLKAEHGDASGVRGAARLWDESHHG